MVIIIVGLMALLFLFGEPIPSPHAKSANPNPHASRQNFHATPSIPDLAQSTNDVFDGRNVSTTSSEGISSASGGGPGSESFQSSGVDYAPRYNCPTCGMVVRVRVASLPAKVRCPGCRVPFVVN
jgi:hypothetical protein